MSENSEVILKPLMTKDEVTLLPLFDHPGKFELVTTIPQALKAVEELKQAKLLGFDTETRPSFRKGEFHHVALLQLANKERCYLFRLNKFPLIKEIIELLENESITKVGVGNRDDVIGLQKLSPFTPKGFIDIAEVTRVSRTQTLSLRSLCGMYLGERLSKAAKVTNWEAPILTPQQLKYAANDAFVALLIFEKMYQPAL